MHASVRPALSVNLPPIATSPAARETSAVLSMRMTISKVNFFYGSKQTLFDVSMGIATNKVTSLIGPSGCGKSTLLRTLNRMYEIVRSARLEGEVLLLDEPCSALDPISTAKIEELLVQLKDLCTIVTVTHNMQQAARISDFTAFLLTGQLIEFSPTPQLFTTPGDSRTEAYITGRFG